MISTPTLEQALELRNRMFPRTFSKDANCQLMTKLFEEGGELAGAINSYFGRKYRPDLESGNREDIKGEIGDVLFTLLGVCVMWETTPDECLEMTFPKLETRHAELISNGGH